MRKPKWSPKYREPTVPEMIIERLRFSPKTRADLAQLLYLHSNTISLHIGTLMQHGYIAGGEYVRGTPPKPLYLTPKGLDHAGKLPELQMKPMCSDIRPRSVDETGGIVASAVRNSPASVWQLGVM